MTLDDRIWHINSNKTTIPRLIAKKGAYIYTVGNKGPIYGCLELDSDLAFEIQDNSEVPGDPQQLNMDILGDQTSSVYYRRKKGTSAKGLRLGGNAVLDGDLAKTLEVKEGTLRFASTTAVDGVQVSFAADTSLQIDFSATGDLATKGVAAANFVSSAADGKIPLQFVGTEVLTSAEKSVAICTVSSALKDSLKFDYPESINRRAVSVTSRDNPDGTVTFFVSVVAKRALVIIFN